MFSMIVTVSHLSLIGQLKATSVEEAREMLLFPRREDDKTMR
jgi:hypothetical protein